MLFWPIFGNFWCPVVTVVKFSSNQNPKNPKKNPKNPKKYWISLRRRHAQTVKNGASSHKTNYIKKISEIINHQGH